MVGFKGKSKAKAPVIDNEKLASNIESKLSNRGKKPTKPKQSVVEPTPVKEEEAPQEALYKFTTRQDLDTTNGFDSYFVGLANLASKEILDPYVDIGLEDSLIKEEELIIKRAISNYGKTQDVPKDIIQEQDIIELNPKNSKNKSTNRKGLQVDLV